MATPTTGAPGGFVQGLLSSLSPWMNGGSPSALDNTFSQYGGTQGLLSALAQGAGPDTTQARTGAAMQRAQALALQEAQARQGLAQGALGTQIMAAKMPGIINYYRLLAAMQGSPQNGGQAAAGGAGAGGTPQSGGAQPSNGPGAAPSASGAPSPSIQDVHPLIRATPQQLAAQGQPQGYVPPPQSAPSGPGAPGGAPSSPRGFWGNPLGVMRFGALGSAFGLPGGQQFFDYGKTAIQYDPAMATRMAVAKNAMTQDQAMYQTAMAQHNPQAAEAAYMKYLKDAGMVNVAAYNGALTTLGGVTPASLGASTTNPVQGVMTQNGVEMPIPGAAATQAALAAARAGGEKRAQLIAETAPVNAPSASVAPQPTGAPTQQPPEPPGASFVVPPQFQGTSAVRQENFIPPVLRAPSNIAPSPGNTSLGQLQTFQKEQAEKASALADRMNEQAQSAQQLLTQADQIDNVAHDFAPGRLADVRQEIMSWAQTVPGLLSPEDLKSLGSAQEGAKLSIQLQAAVTKQLGSREASQVFTAMGKSIPNLTLSPDGLGKISAYLKGIAQYQIAQSTFAQRLAAQGNVSGVNSLQANYQNYSNPVYYILASAPPNVAQELIANMPATERAKVQAGWKQAISMGVAPAPGDYD